jgi:hypothetical protein
LKTSSTPRDAKLLLHRPPNEDASTARHRGFHGANFKNIDSIYISDVNTNTNQRQRGAGSSPPSKDEVSADRKF